MIKELDCVVLTHDIPDHGLMRGDLGAVVLVHPTGTDYEVEFVIASGDTVALLTLNAADVRSRSDRDLPHIRELAGGHFG